MAIIIVAVALALIAIYSYIANCVKGVREQEKWFYDIVFLSAFFREISQNGKYENFIRKDTSINVTRKSFAVKNKTDMARLTALHLILLENKKNDEESMSFNKKHYLIYEFYTDLDKISFAIEIYDVHRKLLNSLANTMFVCKIDKKMLKMILNDSIGGSVYISSSESINQSLALMLQNNEINFKEKWGSFFEFSTELRETVLLVDEIKEFMLNNSRNLKENNGS